MKALEELGPPSGGDDLPGQLDLAVPIAAPGKAWRFLSDRELAELILEAIPDPFRRLQLRSVWAWRWRYRLARARYN